MYVWTTGTPTPTIRSLTGYRTILDVLRGVAAPVVGNGTSLPILMFNGDLMVPISPPTFDTDRAVPNPTPLSLTGREILGLDRGGERRRISASGDGRIAVISGRAKLASTTRPFIG